MTIYSEDYFEPDWNYLINEYHKTVTYVWSKNIQSRDFSRLEEKFMEKVSRNAPNEAKKILHQLQEYEKTNRH